MAKVKVDLKRPLTKKVLSVELDDGRKVYVEETGLKVTTRGRIQLPSVALEKLNKGERRRVRRYLSRNGKQHFATQSVHPDRLFNRGNGGW